MTWIRTPILLPHSQLRASVSAHLSRLPGCASLVVCPLPSYPPPRRPPPTLLQRHCETKHSSAPREFSWVPHFRRHLFPPTHLSRKTFPNGVSSHLFSFQLVSLCSMTPPPHPTPPQDKPRDCLRTSCLSLGQNMSPVRAGTSQFCSQL